MDRRGTFDTLDIACSRLIGTEKTNLRVYQADHKNYSFVCLYKKASLKFYVKEDNILCFYQKSVSGKETYAWRYLSAFQNKNLTYKKTYEPLMKFLSEFWEIAGNDTVHGVFFENGEIVRVPVFNIYANTKKITQTNMTEGRIPGTKWIKWLN